MAHQRPSVGWIATVGWPLGDVLLVAAVASVVVRGAATRVNPPVTVFVAGLVVYLGADVIRAAVGATILGVMAAQPVDIEDDSIPVRASIGVAVAQPGYDGKTLLRQADVAMYHSKPAGSHGHTCYEPSMVDRRADDAALADDLEHALDRGEFYPLYQPLVDLATGRPVGAEALLRWPHPTRGPVSPAEFIPVADAVIRLAQVLHLSAVAEGIETEDQAAELRAPGWDAGQGYLFAKPLTPPDFTSFTARALLPRT